MTIGNLLEFIEQEREYCSQIDSYIICTITQTIPDYDSLSRDTIIVVDHEERVVILQCA